RGQALFTSTHGREWSCSSCHGATPTQLGKHASTGKGIGALAPAFNAERFTDPAKVEKWFRRNCNDVLGRECSAGEKADVLAWLTTLKP
ncbi:MAG: cytochrome C, partial [Burkholderiales bacterium PBB5]